MGTRAKPESESPQPAWQTRPDFILRVFRVSVVSMRVKQSQFPGGAGWAEAWGTEAVACCTNKPNFPRGAGSPMAVRLVPIAPNKPNWGRVSGEASTLWKKSYVAGDTVGTGCTNKPNLPQAGREDHRQGLRPWRCHPPAGKCAKRTQFSPQTHMDESRLGCRHSRVRGNRAKRTQFPATPGGTGPQGRATRGNRAKRSQFRNKLQVGSARCQANRAERTQFTARLVPLDCWVGRGWRGEGRGQSCKTKPISEQVAGWKRQVSSESRKTNPIYGSPGGTRLRGRGTRGNRAKRSQFRGPSRRAGRPSLGAAGMVPTARSP